MYEKKWVTSVHMLEAMRSPIDALDLEMGQAIRAALATAKEDGEADVFEVMTRVYSRAEYDAVERAAAEPSSLAEKLRFFVLMHCEQSVARKDFCEKCDVMERAAKALSPSTPS